MSKKTKSKAQQIVRDKFFAFLRTTSLADGLSGDYTHLGRSYGRNSLLLSWSHQPYKEAIRAVQEIHSKVSKKTIGRVLAQSMVKLFDQHNVREDADPEANAPVLDSILKTLDSSAVEEEVIKLLEILRSQIKTWTTFVFLEGVELKNLVELPLGVATLYSRNCGPLRNALEEARNDVSKSIEK